MKYKYLKIGLKLHFDQSFYFISLLLLYNKLGAKKVERPKLNFVPDFLRTIMASFLRQEINTRCHQRANVRPGCSVIGFVWDVSQ